MQTSSCGIYFKTYYLKTKQSSQNPSSICIKYCSPHASTTSARYQKTCKIFSC